MENIIIQAKYLLFIAYEFVILIFQLLRFFTNSAPIAKKQTPPTILEKLKNKDEYISGLFSESLFHRALICLLI